MPETLVHDDDYRYQINKVCRGTTYYRCSNHARGCPAKIIARNGCFKVKGSHTCRKITSEHSTQIALDESKKFWIEYVSDKAFQADCSPHEIYESLLERMKDYFYSCKYEVPTKRSVFAKINEVKGIKGATQIQDIIHPKLRCLRSGCLFLRRYWMGEINDEFYQMAIWVTEDGFSLLRANTSILIDGTFESIPVPFKQCIIMMIFDTQLVQYIPCLYAIVTAKNESLYRKLFHEIFEICETPWKPRTIATNCQASLISAIRGAFNQSHIQILGYHFKEGLSNKVKKYVRNDDVIKIIIYNIRLLTLLPAEEIDRGIEYIKSKTEQDGSADDFWIYLKTVWIPKYTADMWNFSQTVESSTSILYDDAIAEYHKKLNNCFADQRPPMWDFVAAIKNEFEHYSEIFKKTLKLITSLNNDNEKLSIFSIPSDYIEWKKSKSSSL